MKKYYSLIVIPLLVSLFVYLFYRTEKTLINEIIISLISAQYYTTLKEIVNNTLSLNKFIIYSLPEGLWVFSITVASNAFFIRWFNKQIQCIYFPLLFSIGLELLQLFNFTNGRFDVADIGVSVLFWFLAYNFFRYKGEKYNLMKSKNIRSMVCFSSYGIVYLAHVLE